MVMAKPVKLPKYLQGKNPKPLIEVFEDYKPIDPVDFIKSITAFAFEEHFRCLEAEANHRKAANLAPNKTEGPY